MTERNFGTSGDWLVFRRHCVEPSWKVLRAKKVPVPLPYGVPELRVGDLDETDPGDQQSCDDQHPS